MANVAIKENHLTFGGVAYFRGHAEEVEIGSIGEKRTPLTKQNYLEVKDRLPPGKLNAVQSTIVSIDTNSLTKTALSSAFKAIVKGVPVGVGVDYAISQFKSRKLKLVKFSISNNEIKKAANACPNKLKALIDWGKDARIVHQVFIVMEAEIAKEFDGNINVQLSVGAKGLEARGSRSVSGSKSTTIQISKGTCFAYLLLKIDWDAKQKKNKTKIVDLDDDQWSFS